MTSAAELRELDDDELQIRLAGYRRELLNLRFQLATGQLDNSARLVTVRRDVARALTVLRERDLGELEVDMAPLVLTPVRRRPLDATGGVEEEAEAEAGEAEAGEAGERAEGEAGEGEEHAHDHGRGHVHDEGIEEEIEEEVAALGGHVHHPGDDAAPDAEAPEDEEEDE